MYESVRVPKTRPYRKDRASDLQELNASRNVNGQLKGTGQSPRKFNEQPVGFCSSRFNLDIIPNTQWETHIQRLEEMKATNRDLISLLKAPPSDQSQTSSCWAQSAVNAVRLTIMRQQRLLPLLEGTSVAARVTKGVDQGGWSSQAMKQIIDFGINTTKYWKHNSFDLRQDTDKAAEEAAFFTVKEWLDLDPRNAEQVATCVLNGFPVAVGYNWWGHAVVILDLIIMSGRFYWVIWNSWGSGWGDNGMGLLSFQSGIPDDAVCATASNPFPKSLVTP